jgi:TonB family protein
MFLDFYKIREQPFGETPDPRYLYLSPTHREAIASLAYGIDAGRGFLALVAEPGMGKTTLVFHLLEWLRESARTVFLFQTQCGSHGLLRYLLADLGIDSQGKGLAWMHEQLKEVLINEASVGRHLVVFIDEAQNLSESALETVRLLSDFENPRSKLIQILLVGQPELADKLACPANGQLRQRLSILARLSPFTRSETEAYINHRLSVAGSADRQLFTHGARAMIADWSRGVPRNINNLCFSALSLGYAMGKDKVDCSVVREAVSDLDVNPLVTAPYDSRRPRVLAVPRAAVPCASEVASPEEASGASERGAPSREEIEPAVTVEASGKEPSSVVTFKPHSSRRTMVLVGVALFALFALFVVGAPGISFLQHVLTQPAVASLAPTPSRNAKQTQNSVAGVRPLQSRFRRPEKKPARAVDVLDDELLATPVPVSRWESMQGILAESPIVPAVPPPTPEETASVRVGGDVEEPRLTSRIAPIYPPAARQSGVEGEVVIDAVIDETGRPTNLKVISGPALLQPAALDSVRKWQYRPSYVGYKPIPVEMMIAVEFRLD